MAFAQVLGQSNGGNAADSTSFPVNLPASLTIGELLLVLCSIDQNPSVTWPGGYTPLLSELNAFAVTLEARSRIVDGTEGASITLTLGSAQKSAYRVMRLGSWWGILADGVAAASTPATTANPNPPSLNPADWDVEDTLWIALHAHDNANRTQSAIPVSYGNGTHDAPGDAFGSGLGTARRELAAASEDPGTFTISSSDEWVAGTVAVRPAAGTTPVGRSLQLDYVVRAIAGRSLTLQAALRENVGRSLALEALVRTAVGRELEFRSMLLTLAGRSIDLRADVAQVAGRSLELQSGVSSPVGRSLELRAPVLALAGRSLELVYQLEEAEGVVGKSLTLSYAVREAVGRSLELEATVRVLAGRSLTIPYAVRIAAARSLELHYSVAQLAARELELPYAVREAVGRSLELRAQLAQLAGRSLLLQWQVSSTIGAPGDVDLLIRTTDQIALTLQELATVELSIEREGLTELEVTLLP